MGAQRISSDVAARAATLHREIAARYEELAQIFDEDSGPPPEPQSPPSDVDRARARRALAERGAARDTSTIRPQVTNTGTLTTGNCSAPPARIGLATFGLGKRCELEADREVSTLRGRIVDLSEHARRGLASIAAGEPGAWRVAIEALEQVVDAGDRMNAEIINELKASG